VTSRSRHVFQETPHVFLTGHDHRLWREQVKFSV